MNFKSILLLLLSVAWLLLCQKWYCCWMQDACLECKGLPQNAYPIGFAAGSDLPDTTYKFQELITKLKQSQKEDQLLEISGRYFPNESKTVGMNRALHTLSLLVSAFPNDSIALRSQQSFSKNNTTQAFLPMVDLQWVNIPKEQTPIKLVLFFPDKNILPKLNLNQKSALSKIIEYSKAHSKKIKIDGHSDSSGTPKINKKISRGRAERMAKELINMGVAPDQIITKGLGTDFSIDNDNPINNRRVEITILN